MTNNSWIEIDVQGEMSKRRYYGRVLLKPFLTHAERSEAIRDSEKLLKGIENPAQRIFLTTLAFLKHHILETDKLDWKESNYGMDWVDEAPVIKMAEQLRALQDPEFAKTLQKETQEDKGDVAKADAADAEAPGKEE